jgi:hypothetical protein
MYAFCPDSPMPHPWRVHHALVNQVTFITFLAKLYLALTYELCRAPKDIDPDALVKDSGRDMGSPKASKPPSLIPHKGAQEAAKSCRGLVPWVSWATSYGPKHLDMT